MRKDIVARLEALREELCITWRELADKLGCSRSAIYMIKSGERNPGPKTLRKILAAEVEAGLAVTKCRIRDAAEAEGFIAGMLFESRMGSTPAVCQLVAERLELQLKHL